MNVDRTVTTSIDQELCSGCGLCVTVCPSETITIENHKAIITGQESLNCGHCVAICPTNAVSVSGIDHTLTQFNSFQSMTEWTHHGQYETKSLVNLMMSRRSCRNYKSKAVPREILGDLVKIGITAPSGSNCQKWTFTILPTKEAVANLGEKIAAFYNKLNRMAERTWLRKGMKFFGKPELHNYFLNYYEQVREGLEEWENGERDLLFHGATAVIVVASKNDASCPAEDALLATQNILLGAHSMGLGSCLIGFAIEAMNHDKTINKAIELPAEETPYSVIALGYPSEKYKMVTGRKPVTIRYFGD